MQPRSWPWRCSVTKAPVNARKAHRKAHLQAGSVPSTADITAPRAKSKSNRLSRLSGEGILGLFFRLDEHDVASPPFLNSEIDLAPKHLEIMHG